MPSEETLRLAADIAHQVDPSTAGMDAVTWKARRLRRSHRMRNEPCLSIAWGVSLVFLALCVNVAGLSLARFNERRRQFALSTALGASRGRLVAQAFTQSALVGRLGAAIGIVLAHQLIAGARALLPASFLELSLHPLLLDRDTLFVAIGLALVATIVSGLLPAVVATRFDAGSSLRVVERGGTETKSARVLSRAVRDCRARACVRTARSDTAAGSLVPESDGDRPRPGSGPLVHRSGQLRQHPCCRSVEPCNGSSTGD